MPAANFRLQWADNALHTCAVFSTPALNLKTVSPSGENDAYITWPV